MCWLLKQCPFLLLFCKFVYLSSLFGIGLSIHWSMGICESIGRIWKGFFIKIIALKTLLHLPSDWSYKFVIYWTSYLLNAWKFWFIMMHKKEISWRLNKGLPSNPTSRSQGVSMSPVNFSRLFECIIKKVNNRYWSLKD